MTATLLEAHPPVDATNAGSFLSDVLVGLSAPQKWLPAKYFYDQAGSELFEQITQLDEYYPTRCELAIMRRHRREISQRLGPRCLLIEYGSGSSRKTRLLLDALEDPVGYVPVDMAIDQLEETARSIASEYPSLDVQPVGADFTARFPIPTLSVPERCRAVYFPGSTIGNLAPNEAIALLRNTARLCGPGGILLLGADLRKDIETLEAAYNDRHGVTAAFNRNLLARINRELGGDFQPHRFDHRAFYSPADHRIEMHLVSDRRQHVHIGGNVFKFAADESIHTESSYKYSPTQLAEMGYAGGFECRHLWMDESYAFCLCDMAVR